MFAKWYSHSENGNEERLLTHETGLFASAIQHRSGEATVNRNEEFSGEAAATGGAGVLDIGPSGRSYLRRRQSIPSSLFSGQTISKLSPGQAAYHFLAGYQDGKFVPTFSDRPSPIVPLDLAKSLLSQLKDNAIPSFLINVIDGGKHIAGKDLVDLVKSTLFKTILENSLETAPVPKVGEMREKYRSFLSGKFQEIPEEFSF